MHLFFLGLIWNPAVFFSYSNVGVGVLGIQTRVFYPTPSTHCCLNFDTGSHCGSIGTQLTLFFKYTILNDLSLKCFYLRVGANSSGFVLLDFNFSLVLNEHCVELTTRKWNQEPITPRGFAFFFWGGEDLRHSKFLVPVFI